MAITLSDIPYKVNTFYCLEQCKMKTTDDADALPAQSRRAQPPPRYGRSESLAAALIWKNFELAVEDTGISKVSSSPLRFCVAETRE